MYKFFLQKNDLNDATYYYLDIIKKSILKNDEEVKVVSFLNELCFSDKVITISAKAFFSVWLHNRKQYIVSWLRPTEHLAKLNCCRSLGCARPARQ